MSFLHVWPSLHVSGWDGTTTPTPQLFPRTPLLEALSTPHPAMAQGSFATLPGDEVCPRLTKQCLKKLPPSEPQPVMVGVFVDVDNTDHLPHASIKEADASVDIIADTLKAVVGVRPCYYLTPHGYRLLWSLSEPIPVNSYEAWALAFHEVLRANGVEPDPTCVQWTRSYTLPRATKQGAQMHMNLPMDLRAIDDKLDWWPTPKNMGTPPPSDAPRYPLSEADVPSHLWTRLRQDLPPATVKALRDGRPLAKEGSRDTTMCQVLGRVLSATEQKATHAYQIMARSIAADTSDGAPTLTKLWDRAQTFAKANQPPPAAAPRTPEDGAPYPPPNGAHILIMPSGNYRVWDETRRIYTNDMKGPNLVAAVLQCCPSANLIVRTPKGVPKAVADIVATYGKLVANILYNYGWQEHDYDPEARVLRVGLARAQTTPQYDPQCDQWLRTLAGKYQEKFLDWLATVAMTDKPTCALYLQAPPGVGKGMLADALARLWNDSPVPYADATDNFNGRLADCPIVLLDESISDKQWDKGGSSAFRSLISQSTHRIRQLYTKAGTLNGCPRLLIASNNHDALKLRERLTAEDVAAIQNRVMHILCNDEAAVYLKKLGGRKGTEDWVNAPGNQPGKLVAHIAYLIETRKVDSTGLRYLVEGDLTNWHLDLNLNDPRVSAPLSVIAAVVAGGTLPPQSHLETDADGTRVLWVNANALLKLWRGTIQEDPPKALHLTQTLKRLSKGRSVQAMKQGERACRWPIPVGNIIRVAEIQRMVNSEVVAAVLNGTPLDSDTPVSNNTQAEA